MDIKAVLVLVLFYLLLCYPIECALIIKPPTLPRFLVLQSSSPNRSRYLSLVNKVPKGTPAGLLRFNGQQVVNPLAKFEVENAKIGKGMVHIRSTYNNKYLQAHRIEGSPRVWILASATKPVENGGNVNCTLFKPIFTTKSQLRLRHVRLQKLITLSHMNTRPFQNALFLGLGNVFNVIDWEALVILPQRVAFKLERNGDYLCSRMIEDHPYQKFETGLDGADPLVTKTLIYYGDGNLRVKDEYFGKFWRRSPNWIWADADQDNYSNDTLFQPVKVGDNVIALANLGSNSYVGTLTTEGKTDCLNADYSTITKDARLVVEEPVISREIYNIQFRKSDTRMYDEQVVEMDTATAFNYNSTSQSTVSLKFSQKDVKTRTWSGSVSLKIGVKTTLEVKAIPFILEGKIEFSAEVTTTFQWAETTTEENAREVTYSVPVPPSTTMEVTLMASQAKCDVPFSYTQRDVLTDGRTVTTVKDDGLFTGINAYNYHLKSSVVQKK